MKWKKLGRIFEPKGQYDWVKTHASVPIAYHLGGGRYRIYFGGRNAENKTQTGYIEIDINDPFNILYISPKPVLGVGKVGLFDDSGIWAHSIVSRNNKLFLYYNGWTRGVTVPYYSYIGLAISRDNGKSFERYSPAPIIGRRKEDPYIVGGPWVMYDEGIWKMWHFSAVNFSYYNGKPMYYYRIKYRESEDGIEWKPSDIIAIDFKYKDETRIARPCVLKEDGIYKMWYSYAIGDGGYRIGYAESEDGITWVRKDEEVGIDVSETGWDSEMIEYPYVFRYQDELYMLYNGNGYGKTGIGLAILEE